MTHICTQLPALLSEWEQDVLDGIVIWALGEAQGRDEAGNGAQMKSLMSSPSTSLPQKWEPRARSHLPFVVGCCATLQSLIRGFWLGTTFTVTIATASSISPGMNSATSSVNGLTGGPRNKRVTQQQRGLSWLCSGPPPLLGKPSASFQVRCSSGPACLGAVGRVEVPSVRVPGQGLVADLQECGQSCVCVHEVLGDGEEEMRQITRGKHLSAAATMASGLTHAIFCNVRVKNNRFGYKTVFK